MKKVKCLRIVLFIIFSGCILTSDAQIGPQLDPIRVGSTTVSAGVGFGVPYKGSIGVPFGVKASVDWGVVRLGNGVITIGLAGGGSFSHGSRDSVDESANTVVLLARGAWHYGWEIPGLDVYGGLSSGLALHRFHYGEPLDRTSNSANLLAGIFVGASYFVVPVFGFNAEVGDDITIAQIGIVLKIQ